MASSGRFRDLFDIQEPTYTRDAHGQAQVTYTRVAQRWGRVLPLRATEIFQAEQSESRATHQIVLRRYDGLTSEYRLVRGSRVFNITGIPDAGNYQRTMNILATEAPNG